MGKLCSLDMLRIETEACERVMLKIKQLPSVFSQLTMDRKDVIFCLVVFDVVFSVLFVWFLFKSCMLKLVWD